MMVYKSFGKFADGRVQYEKWLLQRPEFRVRVIQLKVGQVGRGTSS